MMQYRCTQTEMTLCQRNAGYTQFIFLRARWMDPESGRFLSQDTWPGSIQQPASLHKYLYVSANP